MRKVYFQFCRHGRPTTESHPLKWKYLEEDNQENSGSGLEEESQPPEVELEVWGYFSFFVLLGFQYEY